MEKAHAKGLRASCHHISINGVTHLPKFVGNPNMTQCGKPIKWLRKSDWIELENTDKLWIAFLKLPEKQRNEIPEFPGFQIFGNMKVDKSKLLTSS